MTQTRAYPYRLAERAQLTAPSRLAGLSVMVTGLSAGASRDVACSLIGAGASVSCAGDEADTAQLERDLGLYGLTIRAAPIDLASPSEVRVFAAGLRACHDLPHIVVCCCDGGERCPSALLSSRLSPPLYLHLITRDCAPPIKRLLDVGTRDLQSIIRRRLVFSQGVPIRRAMIGRNAFALERRSQGRSAGRRADAAAVRSARHRRSHASAPVGVPRGNDGLFQ